MTPPPAPRDRPWVSEPVALRFEDVTADGRLVLESLPNALEPTVWRRLRDEDPSARACFAQGIVPILTRFVLEGLPGPFTPYVPATARATWQMVRIEGREQLALDMWAELLAPHGSAYARHPGPSDPVALGGRIYAEHVFTRPFAPPGQRRVSSLDFEGAPVITAGRPPLDAPETLADLPAGSRPTDGDFEIDPLPVVFGVVHTDGNRHVNSLAYLRLFEEATLRRLVARGLDAKRLGRRIEIAYRKPCFAGQTLRVALRAFERDGRAGALGLLVDPDAVDDPEAMLVRARAIVRIELEA